MRGHAGADWILVFPGSSSVGVGHAGAAGVFRHSRRRRWELEVCGVFVIVLLVLHNICKLWSKDGLQVITSFRRCLPRYRSR